MRYDEGMFDRYFMRQLQNLVVRYFAAHPEVKLVAVAGSIGKATTRRAIAQVLSQRYRVRMHEAHQKSPIALPAEVLGITLPADRNLFTWLAIIKAAKQRVQEPADVDIIVQELNSAKPGDMAAIGAYLHPDLTVLTGVTPEVMDIFPSPEAVGQEYMSTSAFSKHLLINRDDIDSKFAQLETNANFNTYGTSGSAEYRYEIDSFDLHDGYKGSLVGFEREPAKVALHACGEHMVRASVAAYATAVHIGMEDDPIVAGLEALRPLPGRMNPLHGIDGTTVVDDTHDARSAAIEAGLQMLYTLDTEDVPQRIAVLGDVQRLGTVTQHEHETIGMLCDGSLLTWLVLVGHDMEMYAGPAARARGCQVHVARNAIEAAEFVRSVTEPGAVILVSGSASLYLEETVKTLCNMTEDTQLVRQDQESIAKKRAYFSLFR
jgi:UDP-N-acetylmuramyl pentapeptide synthase